MTRYRDGLGSVGWLVDHCGPLLSFDLSERQRRQNDVSIQDMLELSTPTLSTKSFECKVEKRSIPMDNLRFMGAHDAAHATVEEGASKEASVILAVHQHVTKQKVSVSVLSWSRSRDN